jgi:hypothetical protein
MELILLFIKLILPYLYSGLLIGSALIIGYNYEDFFYWLNWNDSWYMLAVVPIVFVIRKTFFDNLKFWEVFQHEGTHLVFGVLTGNRIESFAVNREGSGHFLSRGQSSIIMSLSPYFFPLYAIMLFAVCEMLMKSCSIYMRHFIWGVYIWFLFQCLSDTRTHQKDITIRPVVVSYLYVLAGHIVSFTFMLHASHGKTNVFFSRIYNVLRFF